VESRKNILFYSSVKNIDSFKSSSFYDYDIKSLIQIGFNVIITNKISSFLKFWKYDIAFLYFYKKSIFPAFISFLFRKKIYFTGGIDELSVQVSKNKVCLITHHFLFKLCYFLSDKCNIVSNSDLNNTTAALICFPMLNSSKLSLWPHGIDIYDIEFDPKVKNNLHLTTICWMGSIENVKRKGLDRCIYFLNSLIVFNKEFRLIIIGAFGDGTIFLKEIIKELNLQDYVIFTGEINNKEKVDFLVKSKYYLQFSRYEGFGLDVIEAMLYYCSIIHSNTGGLKDTIGDNGFKFINFDDYNRLAMEFLQLNKINTNQLLIENKIFVTNKFSIKSRAEYFKNNIII